MLTDVCVHVYVFVFICTKYMTTSRIMLEIEKKKKRKAIVFFPRNRNPKAKFQRKFQRNPRSENLLLVLLVEKHLRR